MILPLYVLQAASCGSKPEAISKWWTFFPQRMRWESNFVETNRPPCWMLGAWSVGMGFQWDRFRCRTCFQEGFIEQYFSKRLHFKNGGVVWFANLNRPSIQQGGLALVFDSHRHMGQTTKIVRDMILNFGPILFFKGPLANGWSGESLRCRGAHNHGMSA